MNSCFGQNNSGLRVFLAFSLALSFSLGAGLATAVAEESPYDILLTGGQILDGTGTAAISADLVIKDERIADLGPSGSFDGRSKKVIDVSGLTITPGFIDLHAHVSTLEQNPHAENFLRQGITTIVNSLHSQDMPWPLADYTATLKIAPNVVYFAGHTWIRKRVMGLENRQATETELQAMRELVGQSMQEGAFGLATGLEYVPAVFAQTKEVIELAKVAAAHNGLYFSHMRDEGAYIIEAFEESIRIGKEAGIPVHINHHKIAGSAQFGWSGRTLALMNAARKDGVDITHDMYPYDAFSTYSDILFPAWALAGGEVAFAQRIADEETRAAIELEMQRIFPQQTGGTFKSIQFRELPSEKGYEGKTLADYLQQKGMALDLGDAIDALIDLQLKGGFIGIFHSMSDEDIRNIMGDPHAMFESDGDLVKPGSGYPHPRSYGSFPRVLAHYVRDLQVLSLPEAINKMTAMPAARLGLRDRGRLKSGMMADIAIFDPNLIQDHSTYTDPDHYSSGVDYLFINGQAVIFAGQLTSALPGRALRP